VSITEILPEYDKKIFAWAEKAIVPELFKLRRLFDEEEKI
jgi:hypothetical protein